jgi:uncharacterized protein (DUF433 family)
MNTPNQADRQLARLITAGTTERELVATVARAFPDLSPTELSQALQVAQALAEWKALRPH